MVTEAFGGPGVNKGQRDELGFGWHDPQDLLQQRVNDRVQPFLAELRPVILGVPDIE